MNYFQKIENKTDWQNLLDRVLFKTFFHNPDWEEFLTNNFKWLKFEHYLYKEEALLTFGKYKILGKEKLISHPFCEYGGPLPLKGEIDGMEFKKNLFSSFKNQFKISFHPQIPKYFTNLGLKEPDSSRDTYFIENIQQKNENEIFASFRKTLRHSIKRAMEQDFKIVRCKDQEQLKVFYNLYLKISKSHKTIPYPFSFLEKIFNSDHAEIILAKHNNKIIAGSLFLFYDKFIHYFLNASDKKYKDSGVNHLILWNQIKKFLQKNYHIFDLGGTRRGSSLEIFKKGWGAKTYPIFELKNYDSTGEEKIKKSKLRNLIVFLPNFLIKTCNNSLLKYKL